MIIGTAGASSIGTRLTMIIPLFLLLSPLFTYVSVIRACLRIHIRQCVHPTEEKGRKERTELCRLNDARQR